MITAMRGHSSHLNVFAGGPKSIGCCNSSNAPDVYRVDLVFNSTNDLTAANCVMGGNGRCSARVTGSRSTNASKNVIFHNTRTVLVCVRTSCRGGKAISKATSKC